MCRVCMKAYRKEHYKINRDRIMKEVILRKRTIAKLYWEYKSTLKCTDCGLQNPWLIEFDHITEDKDDCVSHMVQHGCGWETILKEIDKCEPVCCNCHRLRTVARGQWDREFADLL